MVPKWWGIQEADGDVNGGILLSEVRSAEQNPSVDPDTLVKFLWRDEVAAFLRELGHGSGLRGKGCGVVYERLVELADLNLIRRALSELPSYQARTFLSGQPNGRSVKDFHLPSQAVATFAGLR